ncbi:hypothetical protein J7E63_19400 [Bacillus sp. ISL-75]|uniref:hypothetical protein n=1 Tax=Bacillus sp. ISL-75 TaxID=2819137 RepID=UPI001BE9DC3B|nr:hypothetical protein [Bacillus sp. ISL-75]MBT2729065.1 hypothetical protein [Bacillus sp. ISL-75]
MFEPKEFSQSEYEFVSIDELISEDLVGLEKEYCNALGKFASLLIGAEGTRLLRDREVTGDPGGAKAPRRLQDLPSESECPERKSTGQLAGTIN